jgi:hypothetical protein
MSHSSLKPMPVNEKVTIFVTIWQKSDIFVTLCADKQSACQLLAGHLAGTD